MERVIFVEVLDRRGRVTERTAVNRIPFTLGRGYGCDLILDDPHIDGLHAVIEHTTEGTLQLRDAGSCNGIAAGNQHEYVRTLLLEEDQTVRLGSTRIRLRMPNFSVAAPVPIVSRSPVAHWLMEHWSAALVIPAIWLAVALYTTRRQMTYQFDLTSNLTEHLWALFAFAAWVGTWALFNRILRQHTRFVAHTTVAFTGAIFAAFTDWAFEWSHFFIESIGPIQIVALIVSTLTGGAILLGHLTVMKVGSRATRATIAAVGLGAILSIQLIEHSNDQENWTSTLPYWSRLEAVDPSWLPLESTETYFAGALALETELEALAKEARDEASAKDD